MTRTPIACAEYARVPRGTSRTPADRVMRVSGPQGRGFDSLQAHQLLRLRDLHSPAVIFGGDVAAADVWIAIYPRPPLLGIGDAERQHCVRARYRRSTSSSSC